MSPLELLGGCRLHISELPSEELWSWTISGTSKNNVHDCNSHKLTAKTAKKALAVTRLSSMRHKLLGSHPSKYRPVEVSPRSEHQRVRHARGLSGLDGL